MTEEEQEKLRVALHEAGHAVLAVKFDIRFSYSTIEDEREGVKGVTLLQDPNSEELANFKSKAVIVALAGKFSDKEFNPNKKGAKDDKDVAYDYIYRYFPELDTDDKRMSYFDDCNNEAEKEVEKNMKYIKAIAAQLMIEIKLTEDKVKEIIEITSSQK